MQISTMYAIKLNGSYLTKVVDGYDLTGNLDDALMLPTVAEAFLATSRHIIVLGMAGESSVYRVDLLECKRFIVLEKDITIPLYNILIDSLKEPTTEPLPDSTSEPVVDHTPVESKRRNRNGQTDS